MAGLKILPKDAKPSKNSEALANLAEQYKAARKAKDMEKAMKIDRVMSALEEDEKAPPRTSDLLDKMVKPKKKKKGVLDILDMLSDNED